MFLVDRRHWSFSALNSFYGAFDFTIFVLHWLFGILGVQSRPEIRIEYFYADNTPVHLQDIGHATQSIYQTEALNKPGMNWKCTIDIAYSEHRMVPNRYVHIYVHIYICTHRHTHICKAWILFMFITYMNIFINVKINISRYSWTATSLSSFNIFCSIFSPLSISLVFSISNDGNLLSNHAL